MARLLIAIGGTGQHIALAVARLVLLGALPEMELAVVDSDNAGDLSEALRTFGSTLRADYTAHPLGNGDIIYPPFKDVHGKPKFEELFLSKTADAVERDIFEVCVDQESASFEVKKGMFGRPSLGATILADNKTKQLQKVIDKAAQANEIFVSGSLVGGTGAGLIHQLIKALPRAGKDVFGLIFLRWFRIPGAEVEQTVDDTTQERNMRYGLDYFFRETRGLLKAALLIGQPDAAQAVEATPGEIMHYFHLIAAHGILKVPEDVVKQQAVGSVYAAAFDADHPELMYEEEWLEGRPLKWYVNRANFVKAVLDYASLKKYQDEVLHEVSPGLTAGFGVFKGKPENIGKGLADALKRYPGNQRETAVRVAAETWALLARQYKFALDWLDSVLGWLPEELQSDSYKSVKGDSNAAKQAKVSAIQTIWAEPLPEWQKGSEPSPQSIARAFHDRLVASYT
ncbi:MAG: hypothetical protein ACJ74W_22035 [Pyrinomonadaceae bacterium]